MEFEFAQEYNCESSSHIFIHDFHLPRQGKHRDFQKDFSGFLFCSYSLVQTSPYFKLLNNKTEAVCFICVFSDKLGLLFLYVSINCL